MQTKKQTERGLSPDERQSIRAAIELLIAIERSQQSDFQRTRMELVFALMSPIWKRLWSSTGHS